jgi:hypothetical protein
MSIQDLPSLEEMEAMKRINQRHMADPKTSEEQKDFDIVNIAICDDFIKKIKQAQAAKTDVNTLSQMG